MTDSRIDTLIVLGAGGDLTTRLLLPGLASLLASSRGRKIRLVGLGRDEISEERWRSRVAKAFSASPSERGEAVAAESVYVRGDATSAADLEDVLGAAKGRTALYFALPPAITEQSCRALASLDLPAGLMLALEKPFGTDGRSARALNRLLQTLVPEEQVFRVDHFLGKSTVLNLLGLRFANRLFEPLLSAQHVEKVELVFDEQLGLEGRAGYYDHAGALVDMIQSHMLLVLALATMEPPSSFSSEDLRGAMAQVLRATRPWKSDGTESRRARYGAGTIGRRKLPAYVDEPEVDARLRTETLAEMTVAVDTWRWAGVPFVLRSGKALGENRQDIMVTFRPVPHLPTGFSGPADPAQLRISLKPATMDLDLVTNGRGDPFQLDRDTLHADFGEDDMSAYGEVLGELLEGGATLSVRADVAEECWRIVAPVLAAWRRNDVRLESYPAGTPGPRSWR